MKVGILTFHRALNYGALLQAYALQCTLNDLKIDSEIIDYRNPLIEEMYRYKGFFERKGIKDKIKYLLQKNTEIEKRKKFELFRKDMLLLTNESYFNDSDLRKINDKYNFYITGSDQVWNYDAHGFDKNYFLDFVDNSNKRISYAASFGISKIPEKHQMKYVSLLSGISVHSVREVIGQELIKNLTGLEARLDLDPTLLLEKKQWSEKVGVWDKPERYILLYCFELTSSMKKFIEKLSDKTGLEVRYFGKAFRSTLNVKCVSIKNADPFDFVRSFIYADYVITNSFHGTAFSINLNKTFFVELLVDASSVNSRLENIIHLTGLESRYIRNDKSIEEYLSDGINWKKVNKILDKKRKESISFLKETLVQK